MYASQEEILGAIKVVLIAGGALLAGYFDRKWSAFNRSGVVVY
ncbi:MAG: hypothetical protein Q7S61_02195 [bacterium]|nr:hypothetical protein [bacterium]